MRSVRNWAVVASIAALILLSPVVAFLMEIAIEVLIDGLMEAGVTGVRAVAVVPIGWTLFRRLLRRPAIVRQSGTKPVSDEETIAARPI
jgi:hypothetical protein